MYCGTRGVVGRGQYANGSPVKLNVIMNPELKVSIATLAGKRYQYGCQMELKGKTYKQLCCLYYFCHNINPSARVSSCMMNARLLFYLGMMTW